MTGPRRRAASLAILLALGGGAPAENLGLDDRIRREELRLGEVQDKYATVQRKIRVLTSRRKVLETQLTMNRNERAKLERQIETLRLESDAARRKVESTTSELAAAEAAYQGYLQAFESRLVHIYKRGSLSPMGAMVHARSVSEFVTRARYYRFLKEDAGQLGRLQETRDLIATKKAALEKARAGAERLGQELTARERSLSRNIEEQARLLEQIRRERDHEVTKASKLREASRMLETKIANLNKAADVVEEERQKPRPRRRAVPAKGSLRWPLEGDITIARGFGRATNAAGTAEFNSGIDLKVESATRVHAAAAGRVMFVGVFSPVYGKVVMIDHGGSPVNIISLYGNLETILAGLDQEVRAGDTLGMVGSSSPTRANANYLHFEVRKGTEAQDPRQWLSRR